MNGPDLAAWAAEERARLADMELHRRVIVRRALNLPANLVGRLDRVAAAQDLSRSELTVLALEHYLAHWRSCPETIR